LRLYLSLLFLAAIGTGCGPIAESFNQKGGADFHQGNLAGAQKEFRRAILFNGSNPAYHNNLGYVLYQLKDYDGADTEYQKALAGHPGDGLLRQIQIDQAILYCDGGAIRSKPSHKDWNGKGISVLNGLLVKEPDNAELHMRLGFAYFQAANPGGGFMELDKAVQFATPQEVAHYSQDPIGGSLFILKSVERFYIQAHFLKKIRAIAEKIQKLTKSEVTPSK
jgi:tetratricopeptide (TPR) repeat protein